MKHSTGKSEPGTCLRPSAGKFQPLWEPFEVEPLVSRADQLVSISSDVYRRGYEDGQANAEATFAQTLERERRNVEHEMQQSQNAQLVKSIETLSQSIAEHVANAGMQIRDVLAQALGHVLSRKLVAFDHDALVQAIDRIVDIKELTGVKVAGPEAFVSVLADLLEARGLRITREVREQPELLVCAGDLELKSALPMWIAHLEAMFQ